MKQQREWEPRWRYVCFIAGLLYPIGKPLRRVSVLSSTGDRWPKNRESLTQWAKEHESAHFKLAWYTQAFFLGGGEDQISPEHATSEIAFKILGANGLTWLNAESLEFVQVILDVVSGSGKSSHVQEGIESTWSTSIARESIRRRRGAGELTVGTYFAPHLIIAMRTLVCEKKGASMRVH